MHKMFFCFVLLFLSAFASKIQADAEGNSDHLINKIVDNQQYCVDAAEGDKIYLLPESIVSTDKGLFIKLNGNEFYPLPLLQLNGNGYYMEADISGDIMLTASKRKSKGPCPNCHEDTDGNGFCHNPLCFFCDIKVL